MNGWGFFLIALIIISLLIGGGIANEYTHLQEEYASKSQENETLATTLADANTKIDELNGQLARAQSEKQQDQQTITSLNERIAALEGEINQLSADYNQLKELRLLPANSGGGVIIPHTGGPSVNPASTEITFRLEDLLLYGLLLGLACELVLLMGLVGYIMIIRRKAALA